MHVLEIILPVFMVVCLGYLVPYCKLLNTVESEALSKFTFSFAIPALLFFNTANAKLPDKFEWTFLLSFYGAAIVTYLLVAWIGSARFKMGYHDQSAFGMAAAYSNTTVIGIPICTEALGDASLIPLFTIIATQSLIMYTIGIVIRERHSLTKSIMVTLLYSTTKQILTNPITASLALGIIWNTSGMGLYTPVDDALEIFSASAIPLALFVLGASLYKYNLRVELEPLLLLTFSKLLFFPMLVWLLAFQVFPVSPLWAKTALLSATLPVGISAYIFAKNFESAEATVAASIVLTSFFSLFSVSLALLAIAYL